MEYVIKRVIEMQVDWVLNSKLDNTLFIEIGILFSNTYQLLISVYI